MVCARTCTDQNTAHPKPNWSRNVTGLQRLQYEDSNHSLAPKPVLACPKKPVLAAAEPNRPVAAVEVAGAAEPKSPPVAAAMGLVGPFLPAW